jgi:hypothetical protein
MVSALFTAFALIATGQVEPSAVPGPHAPNIRSDTKAEPEAIGERGVGLIRRDGRSGG